MSPSWNAFWLQLAPRCPDPRDWRAGEIWHGSLKPEIHTFARALPHDERFGLLLAAYQRYRQKLPPAEHSAVAILISELLGPTLKPDQFQVCQILRQAHHYCGHGPDLLPPLQFIERAYAGQLYDAEIFDASRAYSETLRPLRHNAAEPAQVRLRHIAWLDPSSSLECWTAPMRRDYQAMDARESAAWQFLFRHNWWSTGAPSARWRKEAICLRSALGDEQFRRRVDAWIPTAQNSVLITPAGRNVLRILVWHACLLGDCEPWLARMLDYGWHKKSYPGPLFTAWANGILWQPELVSAPTRKRMCSFWEAECSQLIRRAV